MSFAARFRARQYVRGSLWFLPLLGGIVGVLLGNADAALEEAVRVAPDWQYSAGTASNVLSAIVGATVGLLGFVVTISVLVVQSATSTLSPRFMRLWYRDRLQKAVLAMFVATFSFSFTLLRRVEDTSVPDVGVSVAGLAVGVSLLLLLLYLDRFVHRLRPVAVAAMVARQGRRVVAQMQRDVVVEPATGDGAAAAVPAGEAGRLIRSQRVGTIQAVNLAGLVTLARRYECVLVLRRGVGDFVSQEAPLADVYGAGAPGLDARRVEGQIALGRERTIDQDAAFAFRIMVDVAVRALSPAVNDPTTATQVIDQIDGLIQAVGRLRFAEQEVFRDAEGQVRLVLPGREWPDYLRLAVVEIREYGARSVQVCRRLRALLEDLHAEVSPELRGPVDEQLARLDEAVERSFPAGPDRELAHTRDRQGIGGSTLALRPAGAEPPVTERDRAARRRPPVPPAELPPR